MKLVREQFGAGESPDGRDDGPYRFERRETDRWNADGVASACEVAGPDFGRTHVLRLEDCSDGGLGASSDTPILPGTAVSVDFVAPGHVPRRGVVVRCLPRGDGYRLAIRFDRRLAA